MSTAAVRGVVRQLGLDELSTDAALVTRYTRLRDNAAFAELLRRHGPVVLGACRRVLADPHDAEDAFQAVFLVLARKADTVRPPGMVGSWLYGVAVRTANKAKVTAARRWRREMASILAAPGSESSDGPIGGELERTELRAVIDDELGRLPDPLRAPVVLCDLGGKTRAEAARELGCPEGTVAARLHRARKLLAGRLTRRGVALPAAGLVAILTPEAGSAAVSPTLAQTTLTAAGAFAAGASSPVVSPTVQILAEGVLRAMTTGKFKLILAALLAGGLLTGVFWGASAADPRPAPADRTDAKAEPPTTPKPPAPPVAPGYVWDVQFSPDGKRYVVTCGAGIRVHDTPTGRVVFTIPGMATRYSADGKSLFVMGDKVRVYDPDTGKVTREFPRPKAKFEWHRVSFGPGAKRYAAHAGAGIRVYDRDTGFEPVRLDGQREPEVIGSWVTGGVHGEDVFFTPDGKRVIGLPAKSSFAFDKPGAGIWDAESGDLLGIVGGIADDAPLAVAVSPDGKLLATGHAKHVRLWDAATFKEVKNLGDTPGSGPVTALAFGPDGKTLAVGFRKPILNGADKEPPVVGHKTEVQLLDLTTGKELKRFDGFEGVNHTAPTALPVIALAFSPDGAKLVAGTGILPASMVPDGAPKTGEVKVFPLAGEGAPGAAAAGPWREKANLNINDPVDSVAFAPDGKMFATGSPGGTVSFWHPATLARVQGWGKPGRAFTAVAYSPDGKMFAVTNPDGVTLFDPVTGKRLREFQEKGAVPTAIAFGPTGEVGGAKRSLLAFTNGRTVWVKTWLDDAPEGTAQFGPLQGGGGPLPSDKPAGVAYSPDGKQLVFIPNHKIDPNWPDGKRDVLKSDPRKDTHWIAQIWGAGSGAPMQFLKHGTDPVTAVAWSRDGKLVATGGADGDVALWDPTSAKEVRRFKLGGGGEGKSTVHALAFSPDGKTLAAAVEWGEGKNPKRVVLLDLATGARVQDLQSFAAARPVSVAFSPDGKTLVVGCGARAAEVRKLPGDPIKRLGEVRVFTTEPEEEKPQPQPETAAAADQRWREKQILVEQGPPFSSVAFAPDGKTFAVGGDGFIRTWDGKALSPITRIQVPGVDPHLAYSPDGESIAVASPAGVGVYAAATGKRVMGRTDAARTVAYSPDGKWLAHSDGNEVQVIRADGNPGITAETTAAGDGPDGPWPAAMAWSPDSRWLAVAKYDKKGEAFPVAVWGAAAGGGRKNLIGHTGIVYAVAWSADGKVIATGGKDGLVILWDAATGKELWRHPFAGRDMTTGRVHAIAISPDSKTIAAAVSLGSGKGPERVVLLSAAEGTHVGFVQGGGLPIVGVAWSPDGTRLVTASGLPAGYPLNPDDDRVKNRGTLVVWERADGR
ncbi:MAG: hypothetical protein JWO38_7758 [Gemmataceae bacterium]|nr:hypothetical protein [Gemmataceae bacterium]